MSSNLVAVLPSKNPEIHKLEKEKYSGNTKNIFNNTQGIAVVETVYQNKVFEGWHSHNNTHIILFHIQLLSYCLKSFRLLKVLYFLKPKNPDNKLLSGFNCNIKTRFTSSNYFQKQYNMPNPQGLLLRLRPF